MQQQLIKINRSIFRSVKPTSKMPFILFCHINPSVMQLMTDFAVKMEKNDVIATLGNSEIIDDNEMKCNDCNHNHDHDHEHKNEKEEKNSECCEECGVSYQQCLCHINDMHSYYQDELDEYDQVCPSCHSSPCCCCERCGYDHGLDTTCDEEDNYHDDYYYDDYKNPVCAECGSEMDEYGDGWGPYCSRKCATVNQES